MGDIRWYVSTGPGLTEGPLSEDEVVNGILAGHVESTCEVRLVGGESWIPVTAVPLFASALTHAQCEVIPVVGPPSGKVIDLTVRKHAAALESRPAAAPVAVAPEVGPPAAPAPPAPAPAARLTGPDATAPVRACPACLEAVPADAPACPLCGEPLPGRAAQADRAAAALKARLMGMARGLAGRPWARLAAIGLAAVVVLGTGAWLLRSRVARWRSSGSRVTATSATAPAEPPVRGTHLRGLAVRGVVPVGARAEDILPMGRRLLVATRSGVEVRDLDSKELVTRVADTSGTRGLVRIGPVAYALADRAVYVVDPTSARLLRRTDFRAAAGWPVPNADASRVLVPLPGDRSVAVLTTEYHVEIRRLQFEDGVGAVAWAPDGVRALALTGRMSSTTRWYGYHRRSVSRATGSDVYAFNQARWVSPQDHVRLMVGSQPFGAAFVSNERALVALRGEDTLVEILFDASGAARTGTRRRTCDQPERVVTVPGSSRVLVRCAGARALETIDLATSQASSIATPGPLGDLLVSPDGAQAYAPYGDGGAGGVLAIEVTTGKTTSLPLGARPTAITLTPDGLRLYALSAKASRVDVIE